SRKLSDLAALRNHTQLLALAFALSSVAAEVAHQPRHAAVSLNHQERIIAVLLDLCPLVARRAAKHQVWQVRHVLLDLTLPLGLVWLARDEHDHWDAQMVD